MNENPLKSRFRWKNVSETVCSRELSARTFKTVRETSSAAAASEDGRSNSSRARVPGRRKRKKYIVAVVRRSCYQMARDEITRVRPKNDAGPRRDRWRRWYYINRAATVPGHLLRRFFVWPVTYPCRV